MPCSRANRKKPKLLITVTTAASPGRRPSAFICRAKIAIIWSPFTTWPFSSTARHRSASPSKATARSYFPSAIRLARCSTWVLPHSRLMLVPSGASHRIVASAPSRENNSSAVLTAAPLEQSTSTRMPSSRSGTVEARYPAYCTAASRSSRQVPISSGSTGIMGISRSSSIRSISSSSSSVSL